MSAHGITGMIAIILMMIFIDSVSVFINEHVEMKILALVFITAIGVLLTFDGLGITSGIEVLDMHMEKLMVYFAMLFALVMELIQKVDIQKEVNKQLKVLVQKVIIMMMMMMMMMNHNQIS